MDSSNACSHEVDQSGRSASETRLSIFWMRLDVAGADVFQVLARVLLMLREVSGWYWLGIVVHSILRGTSGGMSESM